jgi:HlyD family secretion protein
MASAISEIRKPLSRRWLWFVPVIAVIAIGLFLLFTDRLPFGSQGSSSETLESITADPQPYVQTVTGSGTLQAVQSRDIAPEVSGVVASVVTAGTRVIAGDVLLQLNTSTFERTIRDAQFALEQAQAQRESTASSQADSSTSLQESIANAQRAITTAERDLTTKGSDLELKKQLNAVGSESNEAVRLAQNDYDSAASTLDQAQLNLQTLQESQSYRGSSNQQTLRDADLAIEGARSTLERAQDDLAKTTVVAPFDGVVATVSTKPGSGVNTSTTLLTLIDDQKIELPAQIDETQISKVQVGQRATVTLDALSGETFTGQVTQVAAAARLESNIPIFDVTILLDNAAGRLRDGMSAEANITVGQMDNTVMVPSRAVTATSGQSTVRVVQADGTTKIQNVTVVATEGLDSIIQGLASGQRIVTSALEQSRASGAGPFGGGQ